MATEIADAYIALRVKMPGVQGDIARGLGGGDVDREWDKAGKRGGNALVKAVGGVAIAGIAAAAATAVAAAGLTLFQGFQRLEAIDMAQAKLRGLGNDADTVAAIMQNANASVLGTSFGLGEAANVAAQAVAAGIKPGQQLEGVLKTIANTAAAAGTDLNSMGGIFAGIAATGKVFNDDLQQLAGRGIDIYGKLGEQLGITRQGVEELASEGKIGFAEFAAAAAAASGTVASELGETFAGARANLLASIGRIGAGLLGGVFAELAPTIIAITEALKPLELTAADVGKQIGEFLAPGFELLRNLLEGGFDFGQFAELLSYISPIGIAFQVLQPLLPVLMQMFSEIVTAVGPLADQILPLLSTLLASIAPLFAALLAAVAPLITPLLELVAPLLELVTTILGPLIELLVPVIGLIAQGLTAALTALIPVIAGVVNFIRDLLLPIIQGAKENFGLLIDFITNVFKGNWEGAWDAIAGIFENSWNAILDVGKTVLNGIIDIINGIIRTINGVVSSVGDVFGVDIGIPMIPHLADGATVLPRAGGTVAVLAEAGRAESVVDTGLMNKALEQGISGRDGGNITNNYNLPDVNVHTLAKLIAREQRTA